MLNTSNSTAMDFDDNLPDYYMDFNYSVHNGSNLSEYADYDSDWCEADEQQAHIIRIFQTCVFCFIFLLGVAGNCLVIATFALYRRLRLRSMTDIFLLHLALADLLLLLTLPLQAADTHLGWIFSAPLCKIMRASYAINTYSGLMLLACISVDRYMVVARAQEMLRLRRQIIVGGKLAAAGVWLVAVVLSLPEILFSGVSLNRGEAYCVIQKLEKVKVANGAVIVVFCLSLVVMVICYALIAQVLCEGHSNRRGKQWQRQRTLRLMVSLVVVFMAFQLPYTVVLSRKMAGQFCGLLLEYITCTLAYTRCCLNPILYAMVGVRFRKDVMRLVYDSGCHCGHKLVPQSVSSTSISASSPALTVLSACPPTSPDRSYSSNDAVLPIKFQFPGTK